MCTAKECEYPWYTVMKYCSGSGLDPKNPLHAYFLKHGQSWQGKVELAPPVACCGELVQEPPMFDYYCQDHMLSIFGWSK